MNSVEFVYWLQGFFELQNPSSLNETQTKIIQDHLSLVFNKKTPDRTLNEDDFKDIISEISKDNPAELDCHTLVC